MADAPTNSPWVESPFFRQELARRPVLTAAEIELVTHSANAVSIFGWVFLPGDPGDAVQLTFESDRNSYVVDCAKMKRPDVNVAFPNSPPEAGFQAFVDKRSFAAGVYRVGLLLQSLGQSPLFRFTDRRPAQVGPSG